MNFPKIASIKTVDAFRQHVAALGIELEIDDAVSAVDERGLKNLIAEFGEKYGR